MGYEADKSILAAMERPFEFSCLSTGRYGDFDLCKAQYASGETVSIVKSEDMKAITLEKCPLAHTFGSVYICGCPVRSYLHKK